MTRNDRVMESGMTEAERQIVNRAIGRIFMMASRPEKPDDALEYERCRKVIMTIAEETVIDVPEQYYPGDGFYPLRIELAYVERLHSERQRKARRRATLTVKKEETP
jgi:hypothetical protein